MLRPWEDVVIAQALREPTWPGELEDAWQRRQDEIARVMKALAEGDYEEIVDPMD